MYIYNRKKINSSPLVDITKISKIQHTPLLTNALVTVHLVTLRLVLNTVGTGSKQVYCNY